MTRAHLAGSVLKDSYFDQHKQSSVEAVFIFCGVKRTSTAQARAGVSAATGASVEATLGARRWPLRLLLHPPTIRLPARPPCPSRPACHVQRGLGAGIVARSLVSAARVLDDAMISARARCEDRSMSGTTLRTQPNQGHHVMTPYAWLQRWPACFTMAITMTVVLSGCAIMCRWQSLARRSPR